MELRDKLRRRARPHLEPGERIQAVFCAAVGVDPRLVLLLFALAVPLALFDGDFFFIFLGIVSCLTRTVTIVATDRALLVLDSSFWGRVAAKRLPRDIRIGPIAGMWTKTTIALGPESLYVGWRYRDDVATADAAITLSPVAVAEV